MKPIWQDGVFHVVEKKMREECPDQMYCSCVMWTAIGYWLLKKAGLKPCIQAGTALWPRVPAPFPDDEQFTHFGYQWEPDSMLSQISTSRGNLPETHVWLGLPDEQQIVDFSTGRWVESCKIILRQDWPGPKPPPYFWGVPADLPRHVRYEPNVDATIVVGKMMAEGLGAVK